jgi:predicted MFS family arabinose efflux permease
VALDPYRAVLACRGVPLLLVVAVLARVPLTAAGVALTLHVVTTLHRGYAEAGVVVAAITVGMAVGGPWLGRAVDRLGLRPALWPSVVVQLLVWGIAPMLPLWGLTVAALVAGLASPQLFSVIRQALTAMVPDHLRRSAYALDSMGVEVSFMLGPAVGVLIATAVSTTAALLAVGFGIVVGALALIGLDPPTRSPQEPGSAVAGARPRRADWFDRNLLVVLGATAGATLVLAGTDVSVIAHLRAHGAVQLTGLIFVLWGVGSILGGIVYGAAHRAAPPLPLLLALGVLTVPVGLAPGAWWLAVSILPAAAVCAPVITATTDAVVGLVPDEVRGEAMGWHGAALQAGSAAGAPLAGLAIDAARPWAGFAAVGVAGAVLAAVGLIAQVARSGRGRGTPHVVDSSTV